MQVVLFLTLSPILAIWTPAMMGIASIRSILMFTVFKPKICRNLGLVFGEDQGDPYLPDEYVFSFGVTKTD